MSKQEEHVRQLAYLARLRSDGLISKSVYAQAKKHENSRFEDELECSSPCRNCAAKTNMQCEAIQNIGHCNAIGATQK